MSLTVLVVDRDTWRGRQMTSAFANLTQAYLADNSRCARAEDWSRAVSLPSDVYLIVLHENDSAFWEQFKSDYELEVAEIIRYTGGSIPPSEPSKEVWVRQRSIHSKSDVFSQLEAQAVLDWAEGKIAGLNPSLPPILMPPQGVGELITAIAILCQGYLAVHARPVRDRQDSWELPEIEPALTRMGWLELMKSDAVNLVRTDLFQQRSKVTHRDWWRKAIGDSADVVQTQLASEWRNELPLTVKQLIDEAFGAIGADENAVRPITVNNAYLMLSDCLEKMA